MPGPLRLPLLLAALLPCTLFAQDIVTVAVASNFTTTARELAERFTQQSGVVVRVSSGSTGKLYAQIINGAPFDVFLAADAERPRLLVESGHAVKGTRATYALGALVVWSRSARLKSQDCRAVLYDGDYDHVALANPDTSPYGMAAREALSAMGLWESASERAVFGENISQALQFIATGNATLGFIARAQAQHPGLPDATCAWQVPGALHSELRQQLVLLKRAAGSDAAQRFMAFMRTPEADEIIVRRGYGVPQ